MRTSYVTQSQEITQEKPNPDNVPPGPRDLPPLPLYLLYFPDIIFCQVPTTHWPQPPGHPVAFSGAFTPLFPLPGITGPKNPF